MLAQADLQALLPQDPEVVVGRLANGITYYLRHNEYPKNQADFYIVRDAGSLLETEEQRGLAHFLEHMAFQGTKNFPGKGIIGVLERNGVAFGHDINAVTSENETVYSLGKVPTADEALLDTCVMILHDWSYYLTLDEAEIDSERGVIAEEWRMRNTPESRIQEQIGRVLFKDSRYAGRDVIGSLDVIRNFKPQALRDFYHRWYRSDLEAVIIVGDFDVKKMEERVKAILSQVPAVENPEPRPFFGIPEHDELYYCLATDAGIGSSSLYVITMVPELSAEAKRTHVWMKEELLIRLFNGLMGRRVAQLLRQPDCPLQNAGINYTFFKRGYYTYQLAGMVKDDREEEALRALLVENERVIRDGFTEEELQEVKKEVLKTLEYAYRGRHEIKNADYARQMQDHFLRGNPLIGAEYEYTCLKQWIPAVTVEEVNAKVREWNTDKNKTVIVSGSETAWHLMEEDVAEIMEEVRKADLPLFEYRPKVTLEDVPLCSGDLPGSPVVKEKRLPQFDAVAWTLGNGAKVVFRPSELEMNSVMLRAYSPGGTSLYDLDMLPSAEVAAQLVSAAGLGEDDMEILQSKLEGKRVKCSVAIDALSESISGEAVPEDMEILMQLLYMRFTHPRFDREMFDKTLEQNRMMMQQAQSSVQKIIRDSVKVFQNDYHPRAMLVNADYLSKVDFDKMCRIYRERFAGADDFTFFITGNIPTDTLRRLVEKYIGSIPAVHRQEKWRDNQVRGPQGYFRREVVIPADIPQAMVTVNVSQPLAYSCYNNICNFVLKTIVQARCMENIREKEGGTYVVNVYDGASYEPVAKYDLTVEFSCDPDNVERLKSLVFQELEQLKQTPPTADEVGKAVSVLRKKREEQKGQNAYWLDNMLLYHKIGLDRTDPQNFERILDKLTPQDVWKFTRRFMKNANVADVVFRSPLKGK